VFFLKKTITNSESQFKSDFGEYPPKPLLCMKLNSQFDVVSMGKARLLFHNLSHLFYFFFLAAGKPPTNTSSSESLLFIKEVRKTFLGIKTEWLATITDLKNSPLQVNFVLSVIFLIVCSPLFLSFIVFLCVYILIKQARLKNYKSMGFFEKSPHRPSQIVVMTPALRKYKNSAVKANRTISFEGIVSHEHIHLLQAYYFPERPLNEFDSEKGSFLKSLLKSPERNFDSCSYYFSINEMEARLHEVVLSYYRKYGELPSDSVGFRWLLFGSSGIHRETMPVLKTNGIDLLKSPECRLFDVRCNLMENQMSDAISELKAPFMFSFLLNVLPVMYGNLLIVYGDTNRAEKYFDTVDNFELYNKLYGEIRIPPCS
jgi:hypothetical protein